MKKLILISSVCCALVLFSQSSRAQDNLSLGVTGNFGHTWMKDDYSNQFKPALGIGMRLVYSASEHIGIGGDLKFSAEGAKREAGAADINTNLHYIRVNPQFLYFFGDYGQAVRPKIFVGPSLCFLVGGKIKTTADNVSVTADSKDYYKSFDLGALVGAGVNYRISPGMWLNVELGYNHGLLDQTKSDGNTAYNRNLTAGVGITWGIGKVKPQ